MLLKSKLLGVFSLLLMLINGEVNAQTGKIGGKVIDGKTGETLPGASVLIEGTTLGTATDLDGNFTIGRLNEGVYTLVCKYVSYSTKIIKGIKVKNGELSTVNFALEEPMGDTLNTVNVVAEMNRENTNTLLVMQKNNASLSDGISAELIKKTPDRSTSDVLRRVSGAAIQDNRFVIIRGLNDRYNAAYINGTPLPSTESDRKAFSFDIFPASLLDNLVIIKTATPDLPAEFAGGIIQINTKSIPENNFYTISAGAGYNTITTGQNQVTYKGGKYDWLGIDEGTRKLPTSIPAAADFPVDVHEQAALAKNMKNNWALQNKKFAPNNNYQFVTGHSYAIKKSQLGMVLSASYNRNFNYNTAERYGYSSSSDENSPSQLDRSLLDKVYSTQTLVGSLANFSLKLNSNNVIGFKNLCSINTTDRVTVKEGTIEPLVENPLLFKSTERLFTSNQILSSQISGEHYLPQSKIKINWVGGLNKVKRDIPDRRISRYTKLSHINDPTDPVPSDTVYTAVVDQSSVGPESGGFVFNASNNESIISYKAEATYPFDLKKIKLKNELKAGGLYQFRSRDFQARQLGYQKYVIAGGSLAFNDNLLVLPENEIFSENNMGLLGPNSGGFKLKDGTKPNDSYNANSKLLAAFIMLDSRYSEWLRLIWGVRLEHFNQKLNALHLDKKPVNLNTTLLDVLPSVNAVFSLNSKQNIRAAYTQTLNRPEYRELAPFAYYDFETQFVFTGNDSLKRALIHNYDLRYEIYPGRGQVFSVTGFYKNFINPIEMRSRPDVTREITFMNAPTAFCYGVELEARVVLGSLLKTDSSKFLNNITIYSNYSYIVSKADVSTISGVTMNDRPLQGQSPYVLNSGILYNDLDHGFSVNLAANRVGARIYIVGNTGDPDIWENGRTVMDVQVAKSLLKNRLEIKLNIRDLLAEKQYFFQDKKGNRMLDKTKDDLIWITNFGRTISFNVSYKF